MIRNQSSLRSTLQKIDKNRIYIVFILVFVVMSIFPPDFFNAYNLSSILKTMCLNSVVAIGFTIVMIMGQLDLSIGSNVSLGAMFIIGFQPMIGWIPSLIVATLSGGIVGLVNGLLVAKAKIHSFIVTLGTMTIVQGVVYVYSGGAQLSTQSFSFGDWLDHSGIHLFPPRVIISLILVIAFQVILSFTPIGKGFFMVGGNRETGWLAGLKTDRYLISGFIISGLTAAFSGALFAATLSSALPDMGNSSLMNVIAATIVGGTSMAGGEGNVFKSMIAVLTLVTLYNGLNLFGGGNAIQVFTSGLILAIVVLQEAYVLYQRDKVKGQRPGLLEELKFRGNNR